MLPTLINKNRRETLKRSFHYPQIKPKDIIGIRAENEITQYRLARRLGISVQKLKQFELGILRVKGTEAVLFHAINNHGMNILF